MTKMNAFSNQEQCQMENISMKYCDNSQSGTLSRILNIVTMSILPWQVHVSLPYITKEHYETKGKFLQLKTVIDEEKSC
jgi:hypothetical protein